MSLDASIESVDQLATLLSEFTLGDTQAAEELMRVLSLLTKSLEEDDASSLATVAKACTAALQQLTAGKVDPTAPLLKDLKTSVEQLQLAIFEEIAPEDAFFPVLLLGERPFVTAPTQPPPNAPLRITLAALEAVGDGDLLMEMVNEALDHLDAAEGYLLTLEVEPENREALDGILRGLHTLKGNAGFFALDALQLLAHEAESVLSLVRDGSLELTPQILQVSLQARDTLLAMVDDMRAFLKDDLSDTTEIPSSLIADLQAAQRGEPLEGITSSAQPSFSPERAQDSLRVDADRLDELVDRIGELVITESMLLEHPELKQSRSPELKALLRQFSRITRELQVLGTSMRMVPIRPVFHRMKRLVREVSRQLDKSVTFETTGEATQLDKAIVDRLADPLIHLLRNAIDHGLEASPQERLAAGKSPTGLVTLGASQEGSTIRVTVADDGRGLSRDQILTTAREQGLIQGGGRLSDPKVFELILQPGFSTADAVTDVSGRGVGMDVVKRTIESLQGSVTIDSTPGEGTAFTILLPLTLAIIDGMVVGAAGERYILPTAGILKTLQLRHATIHRAPDQLDTLGMPEGPVPLFDLRAVFGCRPPTEGGQASTIPPLVVVLENQGTPFGLVVDEVQGRQQTVIKPLGDWLGPVPGISGAAILSDGRVGLLVDVPGLHHLGMSLALKRAPTPLFKAGPTS